jgi:phosphoenolpyruvate---glycerone phosphotransferase subunit DhaL
MAAPETEQEAIRSTVAAVTDRLANERAYLTDLDSAIGDADHGGNMARGFDAAHEELEAAEGDAAALVKTVGMALVSNVGGASGPLYGGSILAASAELDDGLTPETTVAFAEAYLEKLTDRGDASLGAATMVDAVTPAVHTYKKSIEQDDLSPLDALAKAVDAAERGVSFTVPLRATKGRASYLGWRSVGHQDPGATSTLLILETLLAVAEEHLDGDGGATDRDAQAPTDPDVDPEAMAGENGSETPEDG